LVNKKLKNISLGDTDLNSSHKKRKNPSVNPIKNFSVTMVSSPIKKRKKKEVIRKKELFGVALVEIMNLQKQQGMRSDVPLLVSRCFHCLLHKFEEEGLFRKSGLHAHILAWKDALDDGHPVSEIITESSDCHSITGLLKLYIRELPTPLVSEKLHEQFFKIMKDTDLLEEEQIEKN